MKTRRAGLLALALAAAAAGSASAHHSYAMYENTQMSIQGTLKEFQWNNPHIFLQVIVTDANGAPVEWSVEGASPSVLSRQGWSFKSLKAGEKLTVELAPLRDGRHGGGLIYVVKADGTRLAGSPLARRAAQPAGPTP